LVEVSPEVLDDVEEDPEPEDEDEESPEVLLDVDDDVSALVVRLSLR